jgi:hypothetical protein
MQLLRDGGGPYQALQQKSLIEILRPFVLTVPVILMVQVTKEVHQFLRLIADNPKLTA